MPSYVGYERLNSSVLRCLQKKLSDDDAWTTSGRLFHVDAAAMEKDWSPMVARLVSAVRGTTSDVDAAEQSL